MRIVQTGGVLALLAGSVLLLASCLYEPLAFDEPSWRSRVEGQRTEDLHAAHHRDGVFFNPWMPQGERKAWRFWRWKLSVPGEYTAREKGHLPEVVPRLRERIEAMPEGDFIAWIGHGTFLIRLQRVYWITDPMFSQRALLPERLVPPALTAEELRRIAPEINVLISHNHYDHLDAESIRGMPEKARFHVPLGLARFVSSLHPGEVVEMDWWQERDAGRGQRVVCLPAQHWSRRIDQGVDETLWASFLIAAPGMRVYYGGDSGYFIGFREFGRRFAPLDYALLPTTAYRPRWFMHYNHMDIPEALDAFADLKARFFIPTQWGTFPLGDEPPGYPALDLQRTIRERGLDPERFAVMGIGQLLPLLPAE